MGQVDLLSVLRPGSPVLIAGDIEAHISGVILKEARGSIAVLYEVVWWDERERREAWLSPSEITPRDPSSAMRIGFNA